MALLPGQRSASRDALLHLGIPIIEPTFAKNPLQTGIQEKVASDMDALLASSRESSINFRDDNATEKPLSIAELKEILKKIPSRFGENQQSINPSASNISQPQSEILKKVADELDNLLDTPTESPKSSGKITPSSDINPSSHTASSDSLKNVNPADLRSESGSWKTVYSRPDSADVSEQFSGVTTNETVISVPSDARISSDKESEISVKKYADDLLVLIYDSPKANENFAELIKERNKAQRENNVDKLSSEQLVELYTKFIEKHDPGLLMSGGISQKLQERPFEHTDKPIKVTEELSATALQEIQGRELITDFEARKQQNHLNYIKELQDLLGISQESKQDLFLPGSIHNTKTNEITDNSTKQEIVTQQSVKQVNFKTQQGQKRKAEHDTQQARKRPTTAHAPSHKRPLDKEITDLPNKKQRPEWNPSTVLPSGTSIQDKFPQKPRCQSAHPSARRNFVELISKPPERGV